MALNASMKVFIGGDQSPKLPCSGEKQDSDVEQEVAIQQDTSVAAPSTVKALCKKLGVASHGTFSHSLQTS